MRKFITKNDRLVYRILEILPGFFSWNVILFPYWGIFLVPTLVAYFVLGFNVYWFYQSLQIAITATISHLKMQAAMSYNWMADVKGFPDFAKLHQVIIIPTYKEPIHTLIRTFNSLASQEFPTKQITVVLAMEGKEPRQDRDAKVAELKDKFERYFANFFVTVHELEMGEVAGKSSNERYAAIWTKRELIDKRKLDIGYMTITSSDADHIFHPKHFATLAYKFLDNPKRYQLFWQPAVMFYNNIWALPAITRVPNTLSTIWNFSQLPRRDRLLSQQNYSLSFKLLDDVGYWDPDKIPEDWGIFFKAFFAKKGGIEVEPLYLPVYSDAAQGQTLFQTLKSYYQQQVRWAWGVSDTPWILKNYLLSSDIPFLEKTMRVLYFMQSHFFWPVNWFIITIGVTLPTILNPAFGRTSLGYMVPKLSSLVLTMALGFLVVMFVIDNIYKPKRPKEFPAWRALLTPLEFVLMPIAGFFFSALPGLDAHTRLMLGKYLEYRVTEKV